MKANQFTCTNVRGIIERANEILTVLPGLGVRELQRDFAKVALDLNKEVCDDSEYAAWVLVLSELNERQLRFEDKTLSEPDPRFNGGLP